MRGKTTKMKRMIKMTNNWVNHGDVNPIPHGGLFVQQESETDFRIIRLTMMEDGEHAGKFLIEDLFVDVTDSWQEKESVMDYADIKEENNLQYALALISYYSAPNFGCHDETFYTEEEAKVHLKLYGIEIE
jgi:hypothetical protein